MLQKKIRCHRNDCPNAQYRGSLPDVTVKVAKQCSKRQYGGCAGNRFVKR